jgi:hypothetical protein
MREISFNIVLFPEPFVPTMTFEDGYKIPPKSWGTYAKSARFNLE